MLQTYRLLTTGDRLWTLDFGLWTSDSLLRLEGVQELVEVGQVSQGSETSIAEGVAIEIDRLGIPSESLGTLLEGGAERFEGLGGFALHGLDGGQVVTALGIIRCDFDQLVERLFDLGDLADLRVKVGGKGQGVAVGLGVGQD